MVEILQVKYVFTRATPTLGISLKGPKMFDDVHIDLTRQKLPLLNWYQISISRYFFVRVQQ